MIGENMKVAILDLTKCSSWDDLHRRIQTALGFPDYYGKNWSAFWDCLSRDCDVELLQLKGINTLPKEYDREISVMLEYLDEMVLESQGSPLPFDYEILS